MGPFQYRQLQMHGLVHNVLGGTERANLARPTRHRDEDGLRPLRLAVTYVECRSGPEQHNLADGCPDHNFKARRSAQEACCVVQNRAQEPAFRFVPKDEAPPSQLRPNVRARCAHTVEEPTVTIFRIELQFANER
jgi:hypothetical protein